jgi:ketosteroid isomerase-like protein
LPGTCQNRDGAGHDKVIAFAQYSVEALVPATGRVYRQMYAVRLVAKNGKIQWLRESLDTVAAAKAFAPVDPA